MMESWTTETFVVENALTHEDLNGKRLLIVKSSAIIPSQSIYPFVFYENDCQHIPVLLDDRRSGYSIGMVVAKLWDEYCEMEDLENCHEIIPSKMFDECGDPDLPPGVGFFLVYRYAHGGERWSLSPFDDRSDSGAVGVLVVWEEDWDDPDQTPEEVAQELVHYWDILARGEVYDVYFEHENGMLEQLEWAYVGLDNLREELPDLLADLCLPRSGWTGDRFDV